MAAATTRVPDPRAPGRVHLLAFPRVRRVDVLALSARRILPLPGLCRAVEVHRRATEVTTEDDFQAKLDADPSDWQTRLVFADWLDEHDDPRAEGYRALGVTRRYPAIAGVGCLFARTGFVRLARAQHCELSAHWFGRLPTGEAGSSRREWQKWFTRRAAEDAAALAFAKLPAERRAELLAAPVEADAVSVTDDDGSPD